MAENPRARRAAARAVDERRVGGETSETLGLLAGLPMTVKDTFELDKLPTTAVPAGSNASGLPVGVPIIGPRGGDSKTLAAVKAMEERFGGFRPPPLEWPGHS